MVNVVLNGNNFAFVKLGVNSFEVGGDYSHPYVLKLYHVTEN